MPGQELRMRVFAGPNGSGKSTVIKYVRSQKVNDHPIDFGIYINADDIARDLQTASLKFSDYDLKTTNEEFESIAIASGLVAAPFSKQQFNKCYEFSRNAIKLLQQESVERLAQIIADFIRKKLLQDKKRFSFETVFSHNSKLDIMRDAAAAGYKVYLYFVSTESADINVYRVAARKEKGGHDVPEDKIRSRYVRSLDLLYDASQMAYQAFYFDNSEDGTEEAALFAHFKKSGDAKNWDEIDEQTVPVWFRTYYSDKVKERK